MLNKKQFLDLAIQDNRSYLYENEAYDLLKSVGVKLPFYRFVEKSNITNVSLDDLPDKLVVKAVARDLFHKTRVGGVAFISKNDLFSTCKNMMQIEKLVGFLIVEQVKYKKVGVSDFFLVSLRNLRDFGLVANFALGGTETEIFAKHSQGNFVSFLINEKTKNFLETANWPFKYLNEQSKNELIKFLSILANLDKELKKLNFEIEELEINPIAFTKDTGELVPLDAVFRFKQIDIETKKIVPYDLEPLFFPKRVAVAGVSSKNINMGRIILRNLIEKGFNKDDLFVLKPNENMIDDIQCVADVKTLQNIDVLVLAVKSTVATSMIEELSELKNVKHIILIPGGFAETTGGKDLEKRVSASLQKSGIGLVGGNCLGIVSHKGKLDTFFIPKEKLGYASIKAKPYAFISQSGAFVISKLSKTNIIPLYAVSAGNQTGLKFSDYLDYFVKKDDINTIALYIEGFKEGDGLKLLNILSKTKKRIIVYKAGRTTAGQKAAGGHTASIASDYGVSKDLLIQAGALVVETLSEYEDLLKLSLLMDEYGFTRENLLQNKKLQEKFSLFIIANAGFETVSASDNLLKPLSLSESTWTQKIIEKHKLETLVNANNPLDLTPSASDKVYLDLLDELQNKNDVDFIVFSAIPMTPALKSLDGELDETALFENLKKYNKKPLVLVVDSGKLYDKLVQQTGVVAFREIDRVLRGLQKLC